MKPLNLDELTSIIQTKLCLKFVSISDDSHKHKNHQPYQHGNAYLNITISNCSNLPRIQLHRKIKSLALKHCNLTIHAISIKTGCKFNNG
ncbi:BolA/IbaG family iron-sulfur metabolism protein [Candidatus Synchoanobacter obligatus]|uniref:BolA/IbaG family iron-sulfur metabolism protein n=1 Tax=Candidatus Synchoanobacter obligatus TaxID=2919597 RepID=UPI003CC664C7